MFPTDLEVLWAVRQTWAAGQGRAYPARDVLVFWLIEAGQMLATVDRATHLVRAGEAFLQFPGVARTLTAEEPVRWASVGLSCKMPRQASLEPWQWRPNEAEFAALTLAFDQILECRRATNLSARWRREGAARLLVGLCWEHAPQKTLPEWIQTVVSRIESTPNLDLTTLASECGYSPTQFRVRFKEYVGLAPSEFASQCLATRAQTLLSETDWPMKRIADELDFAADTHFCRFFKRRFGMTPTEFRRDLLGG